MAKAKRANQCSNIVKFQKIAHPRKIVTLPKNIEQEDYLDYLNDDSKVIVVATGRAGTGKTYIASSWAVEQLQRGEVNKIIVTRPNIPCDDGIGFLKGDMLDKMRPWIAPILDVLEDVGYDKAQIEKMIDLGEIEVVPVSFLRGRSFKDAVIIADEVQNLSKSAMLSLLTRVGTNSKLIVCGDEEQSDMDDDNGLKDFIRRFRNAYTKIALVELYKVERSEVVEEILEMYGDY